MVGVGGVSGWGRSVRAAGGGAGCDEELRRGLSRKNTCLFPAPTQQLTMIYDSSSKIHDTHSFGP